MRETDLVTGATGFIGHHLTARLVEESEATGRRIRVFCRPESTDRLDLYAQTKKLHMTQGLTQQQPCHPAHAWAMQDLLYIRSFLPTHRPVRH